MRRREFTSILAGAVAAAVSLPLDPDLALWVPGRKKIFIPSPISQPIPQPPYGAQDLITIGKLFHDYMLSCSVHMADQVFPRVTDPWKQGYRIFKAEDWEQYRREQRICSTNR